MTIVCAIRSSISQQTWIGSDTIVVNGWDQKENSGIKWVVSDDETRALSTSGSFRGLTLLREHRQSLLEQEANEFEIANKIKDIICRDGWRRKEDHSVPLFENAFIFATSKKIFSIHADFSITEVMDDEICCQGSGEQYALGAYFAIHYHKLAMDARLSTAMRAAIQFDSGCGGEILVRRLSNG